MFRLLKVDLKSMFKWKPVIYVIGFSIVIGAFMAYVNNLNNGPALDGLFSITSIPFMMISIITGLFVYQDYSQNTIRNKICVGHSRWSFYISKFIISLLFSLLLLTIYFGVFIGASAIFSDISVANQEYLWKGFVMAYTTTIFIAALTSLFSVNIKSPLGAFMPLIIDMTLSIGGSIAAESLLGEKSEKVINAVLSIPVFSAMSLTTDVVPAHFTQATIVLLVSSLVMFVIGYFAFRKADLK